MPFPGGLAATANGTLLLSLVAALVYLTLVDRAASFRRTVVKTLAVLLLAVLSFLESGPLLLTAALLLSAVGDALLARETERTFLAGLVSFLLAHLAYVGLFAAGLIAEPAHLGEGVWRVAALMALCIHVVLLTPRLMAAAPREMRLPILAYIAAIAAMGMAALLGATAMVVAGAALFIASDTILAVERFLMAPASPHRRWTAPVVWITYYAGQALIALAFLV